MMWPELARLASQFISHDQADGHYLPSTGKQWKKKMPLLDKNTEVFIAQLQQKQILSDLSDHSCMMTNKRRDVLLQLDATQSFGCRQPTDTVFTLKTQVTEDILGKVAALYATSWQTSSTCDMAISVKPS